jgi:lysyl-tRNA synthetase class 2
MERVFEIARNFRNEGISTRHNPEFSMLELYEAQADYRRMLEITEGLLEHLACEINGNTKVTFRGREYDLKAPFQRASYIELFREKNGCEFDDRAAVVRRAKELEVDHGRAYAPQGLAEAEYWKLMNDVFEATVEDTLTGPIFVLDYPVQICPLAKKSTRDARLAERFELFVAGMEIANAYTELNDPEDQEARFAEQVASKDPEAPGEVDVDYVQALEYGMPPTGGLGIGIDRLVMVLTNQDSIRDVLLFPALRRVTTGQGDGAPPAPPVSGTGAFTPPAPPAKH